MTTKTKKIIYWIFTIWFSFGMLTAGIVQLIPIPEEVEMMTTLGYPLYLLVLLGISKLLGVIAILIPKFPVLKEWAYAGFFFNMAGAAYSHIMVSDPIIELIPCILNFILIGISWYYRPEDRKVVLNQ